MKKGKEKEKKKKSNNSPEKKTKQTAIFDGFLVYEKVSEEEENFQKMNDDKSIEGPLNKWLIMQHNSKETKSRFSNLFKEIQENDKKEGKNIDNDNKNINSINDQKLISNNLMEKEGKNIDNNNVINNMNEAMKNLKIDDNRSDNENINNNINDNINKSNNNYNNEKKNIIGEYNKNYEEKEKIKDLNTKENELTNGFIKLQIESKNLNIVMTKIKKFLKNKGYSAIKRNLNELEMVISNGDIDALLKIEKYKKDYVKLNYYKLNGLHSQFELLKKDIHSLKTKSL